MRSSGLHNSHSDIVEVICISGARYGVIERRGGDDDDDDSRGPNIVIILNGGGGC